MGGAFCILIIKGGGYKVPLYRWDGPYRGNFGICPLTLIRVSQHSPLGEYRDMSCLVKTPKNPVGKIWRKSA